MAKKQRILISLVAACALIGMASCRPRSTRSRATKPATQTPQTQQQSGTTAKQVLAHTDSAIQRVSELNEQPEQEKPPVATEPGLQNPSRTPWGAPSTPPRPSSGDYDIYQAGLGAYNAGWYDQAIADFGQVATSGHPVELVPNAYYWMGESYFAMNRFAESMPYFEYVVKAGPEYKRQIAFYKLALASDNAGNRQAANLWYERLRTEYPTSTYGPVLAKRGLR